ncbi:hypothetical protein [Meiothermus sp.]|uniref:hypothetical protein n=1 Tax=Meiothermus sp. TaxID=1955249 RepID=UPI0021DF194B|nr:hypothetical protein [Meiothermus sp.]GIW33956.1 MAG: hypothetical protein KatS3mg072_1289 [Meiothermus sp.]
MRRFWFIALLLGFALAQKDPHPCYLMGIFNANNTPNALGSLGFVMSNEGILQDGKPLSGSGGQAEAQAMAQAIGSVQPMSYCIQNLSSGGVIQLQYFRSSPQGAQHWLGGIRKGAPSWVGLNVGDEAGLFRSDQSQPVFSLAFRYREYAFLLTHSSMDPESYRKWALAVIERVKKFK